MQKRRSGLSGFRVSVSMLSPLLSGLRTLGADVDAIVRRADIEPALLQDPDTRITFEQAVTLSAIAAEAVGDEAFGLHLAEMYRPGVFGVLDYLAHSSRTLHEAIDHLCRYNRLLQDAAETLLEVVGSRAVIWQRPLGGAWMPPELAEHAMANLIMIGRALTGTNLTPLQVSFRHSPPRYVAEHERIFNAPISFNAERDAIVLDAEQLALPLTNTDPGLCSILDRHAQTLLAELPRVADFTARVRALVAENLKSGVVTHHWVAQQLYTSTRTLGRRLRDEGTTYESIVDDLRRALTERYLHDPTVNFGEIALLVGYSESSTFRRAFRRWHGTSPAIYRGQLVQSQARARARPLQS